MTGAEWIDKPWPSESTTPAWAREKWRLCRELIVELAPECTDYAALARRLSKAMNRLPHHTWLYRVDTRETLRTRLMPIFEELWRESLEPSSSNDQRLGDAVLGDVRLG